MRSPILAFSLFAVVGPSIVAAAPSSPKLGDGTFVPGRNDVNLSKRYSLVDSGLGPLADGVGGGGGSKSLLDDSGISRVNPVGGDDVTKEDTGRKPSQARPAVTPSFLTHTPLPTHDEPTAPPMPTPTLTRLPEDPRQTDTGKNGTPEVTDEIDPTADARTVGDSTPVASSGGGDRDVGNTTDEATADVSSATGNTSGTGTAAQEVPRADNV